MESEKNKLRKKVLLFSREYPPNIVGGTAIVARSTAEGLTKLDYIVTVISTCIGRETERKEINGVDVLFVGTSAIYMDHSNFETQVLRNHKHIVDVTLKEVDRPDIILVPDVFSFPEARIIAKKYGVKLINILLQDFSKMTLYDKNGSHKVTDYANANEEDLLKIEKKSVIYSDMNVFISNALAQSIIERYSLNKDKCRTIHLGIDFSELKADSYINYSKIPNFIGEKEGKTFATIGRMVPIKGFDSLIRAFKIVHEKYENTFLYLMGRGPEVEYLNGLIEESGLTQCIKIFYEKDRKKTIEYMRACDYAVVPSLWESFCYVAAEFMALEKPLIVNGVDSLNELMIDNETGYVLPAIETNGVRSVDEVLLAEKMVDFIESDVKAQMYARKAKERIEKFFVNEIYAEKMSKLIQTMLISNS